MRENSPPHSCNGQIGVRSSLVFGPSRRCRDCSTAEGPVTNVLFTAVKTTDPASELTPITFSPHKLLGCLRMSTELEPSSIRNSVTTLPSTYVHNIRHFALLLCWTHVTNWSTDNPGGDEQCRYPVGKARNYTLCHILKKTLEALLSYRPSPIHRNKVRYISDKAN